VGPRLEKLSARCLGLSAISAVLAALLIGWAGSAFFVAPLYASLSLFFLSRLRHLKLST